MESAPLGCDLDDLEVRRRRLGRTRTGTRVTDLPADHHVELRWIGALMLPPLAMLVQFRDLFRLCMSRRGQLLLIRIEPRGIRACRSVTAPSRMNTRTGAPHAAPTVQAWRPRASAVGGKLGPMASSKRSDGEGSLYQRHVAGCPKPVNARGDSTCKCVWRGALVIGWSDGKPIRKRITGANRAAAATKLRKLAEEVQKGQLPHGRIPTVSEWVTYWLEQIVTERNRPNTVRTYRTYVEQYIVPKLGRHRLDKLTQEHIARAWKELRAEGLGQNSVHNVHAALSRSLKVAQQRGKVVRNVATLMDAPPRVRKAPVILDKDQARAVIAAAKKSHNAARWTVAFSLGLRQGEALGLRWSDVDLDAGTLTVRHSLGRVKGKGLVLGPTKGGKDRVIVLPAPLLVELKAHRKAQNIERLTAGNHWHDLDYLFPRPDGKPIDPRDDRDHWKALIQAADVPDVTGHTARHTAATLLLALGVAIEVVKEILGHSSITVTQLYQHRVNELHLDAAERMASAYWD